MLSYSRSIPALSKRGQSLKCSQDPKNIVVIIMAHVATFKTKLTEMCGIQHPIIQGGMHYVGYAEMAAGKCVAY